MVQRFIVIVIIVYSTLTVVKYRYRILNALLRNRWLRRFSVALVLQIPLIREKLMGQILR